MADYQLRARIPHELADEVKEIVERSNEVYPEGEATFSTVSRYALKKYVEEYNARFKDDMVVVNFHIPYKKLNNENLRAAIQMVSSMINFMGDDQNGIKEKLKQDLKMMELELKTRELDEILEKKKAEQGLNL